MSSDGDKKGDLYTNNFTTSEINSAPVLQNEISLTKSIVSPENIRSVPIKIPHNNTYYGMGGSYKKDSVERDSLFNHSHSWSGKVSIIDSYSPPVFTKNFTKKDNDNFIPYDAINKCKSAGVIPYCIENDKVYFLFQRIISPLRKKDSGWNDFGGKKISLEETTAETAAREFSEETSCLFYLKENPSKPAEYYEILKDNKDLEYNDDAVNLLKELIKESKEFYKEKITEYVLPIYISSKETYISYFIKVPYIPVSDLPHAEDIHIYYDERYVRECKWFTIEELMELNEKDFHKRLQITRIQQRINSYYAKGLFT